MMVKKNRKRVPQKKMTGAWVVLMLVFISELLLYTWCRVQCVKTGYEITEATKNYQRLTTLRNNLRVELARLKSPKRIAEIGRKRLGLKMPNAEQTIIIP